MRSRSIWCLLLLLATASGVAIAFGARHRNRTISEALVRRANDRLLARELEMAKHDGELMLYESLWTDEKMRKLREVPELRELAVVYGDLDDRGLRELEGNSALRTLCLYSVDVTDRGVSYLTALHTLENLGLIGCDVTPRVLRSLTRLPRLRRLIVYPSTRESLSEDATAIAIESLAKYRELRHVSFGGNWFSASDIGRISKSLPSVQVDRLPTELDFKDVWRALKTADR